MVFNHFNEFKIKIMNKYLFLISCFCLTSFAYGQSLRPILLSFPTDKDTITELEPSLIWQSDLAAIMNDSRISQVLIVSKIMDEQTALEAVMQNEPVFYQENILTNSLTYPSNYPALEMGATYAWQIQIKMNDVVINQSDAYQFTIFEPLPPLSSFSPVKFKNDGLPYMLYEGRLNLSTTLTGEIATVCTIANTKGMKKTIQFDELLADGFQQTSISQPSTHTRYFSLNIKEMKLKKGYYTVVCTLQKNQVVELLFQIK